MKLLKMLLSMVAMSFGILFVNVQAVEASSQAKITSCHKKKVGVCYSDLKNYQVHETVYIVDVRRKGDKALVAEGRVLGKSKNGRTVLHLDLIHKAINKRFHRVVLARPAHEIDWSGAFSNP